MSVSNLNDINTNKIKCNELICPNLKLSSASDSLITSLDITTNINYSTVGNVNTKTKVFQIGRYAIIYFETDQFPLLSLTTPFKLSYAGVSTPNVDIFTSYGTFTWESGTERAIGQLMSTDVGQQYINGILTTTNLGTGRLIGSYTLQLA